MLGSWVIFKPQIAGDPKIHRKLVWERNVLEYLNLSSLFFPKMDTEGHNLYSKRCSTEEERINMAASGK